MTVRAMLDDGSMVLMLTTLQGGHPRGEGIGASGETHEKKKRKEKG